MALGFQGQVSKVYELEGRPVLLLNNDYAGDIEAGDWVQVESAATGGTDPGRVYQVETVAWGSAFHLEDPPLSLVLRPAAHGRSPVAPARVRGVQAPLD